MPIGSSAGAARVRESVGGHQERGAEQRDRRQQQAVTGPTSSRSRCGTTMPTNPITPATDTAAPVAAATSTIEMRLRRSTSIPP